MKHILVAFLICLTPYLLTAQSIDERVDSLVSMMSLAEKVGQMTQVERSELNSIQDLATYGIGSVLSGGGSAPAQNTRAGWANMYDAFQSVALQSNLRIPIIYAVDAVHGHNNVPGAVIFPHNIGLGCTWNPELVQTVNEIVAKEVAATGIDWTFAPCIAVPRNERWGRTYEGFGETPEVQAMMSSSSVLGLQQDDLSAAGSILACAKHFVGDGGTADGIDQGHTNISETALRDIHMPGYEAAIAADVGTVMASYSSWNGEKLHGSSYLLTDVLKDELGFDGFVISDWKGVDQVDENYRTAIKRAINAGIDMVMVPDRYEVFIGHLIDLVNSGEVPETRIDDAVARILRQKILLNLFKEPFVNPLFNNDFGSSAHRDVARQAVRESMVLLNAKNDILPLSKQGQNILVAGSLASDLGAQCGGWTISWQGGNGNITEGTTILEGIQNLTVSSDIIYDPNGSYNGPVDVAVVVVGEKTPYAEGVGDRANLELDGGDIELVKSLKAKGIPVVTLVLSGRPMIITELMIYSDAVFAIWYPGSEGDGVAEVLFGDYEPSGQLTHSWPKDMSQVPINLGDTDYAPLFDYRYGLQNFPKSSQADHMTPYAGATNEDGLEIVLSLSDRVTTLEAIPADFTLHIGENNEEIDITGMRVADYDSTIIILTLSEAVSGQDELSLSYVGTQIFSGSLSLDSFDRYYILNAVESGVITHSIPGRIEAEAFLEMSGIQTEPCTDIGGGLNVGFIEAGDWLDYRVNVTESGNYRMINRLAGFGNGTLLIAFNDSIETEIPYTATDGWQNWADFTSSVYLPEGSYTMRAQAQADAFNINYYEFELIPTSIPRHDHSIVEISAFPNPMNEFVMLEFINRNNQDITISLVDVSGRMNRELFSGKIQSGLFSERFDVDQSLPSGTYFIEVKNARNRHFIKLIK